MRRSAVAVGAIGALTAAFFIGSGRVTHALLVPSTVFAGLVSLWSP